MAYNKTNWKDHVIEFPNRYKLTPNPDGTVLIEKQEGEVQQYGTPVNAVNLNKIEDELERQSSEIELQGNVVNRHEVCISTLQTELQAVKDALFNNFTDNVFFENFVDLNDIIVTRGWYDEVNKKLVV